MSNPPNDPLKEVVPSPSSDASRVGIGVESRGGSRGGSRSGSGLSQNIDSDVEKAVLDLGLATRTELEFCREQQKQSSDPNQRSLTDLLVDHQFITNNQAKRIRQQLDERRGNKIPGYQILGKVGRGAMAVVYKARQVSLDRIVAIKILPRRMSEDPDFVQRFYKEGKAAARLSHNNIVQAIDVGSTQDGVHYFVMEFIEGKTLYDLISAPHSGGGGGDGVKFTEKQALEVGIQITSALAHAHERGLVHRDVKPKNILQTPQGVAKLTDLGLARDVDDKQAAASEEGKAYGTPYYISPEQIRGDRDIDFRADIYAMGATLYHLVTGRPPFEGATPAEVMQKHLKGALTPPDHLNGDLTQGISEIIECCLAKRREDRYASTTELLEDLKAVREGAPPIHARRPLNLDDLSAIESGGRVLPDVSVGGRGGVMRQPIVLTMVAVAGVSVLANVILLVFLLSR